MRRHKELTYLSILVGVLVLINTGVFALDIGQLSNDSRIELSSFEYTCVYNLQGDIINEVKSYIRLTPPAKMAYISEQEEFPKLVTDNVEIERPDGCIGDICEGLTLTAFEEEFVFKKNTVVDDIEYFQIKTSNKEKYYCYKGID